jgi:hypothetical protein
MDHTEHGFAGKLKAIGRGIARFFACFAIGSDWRSRSRKLPAARIDATSTSRYCSGVRPVSASLVMVVSPQENATARGDSCGQVRGQARPLLFTYRADERIDGGIRSERFKARKSAVFLKADFQNAWECQTNMLRRRAGLLAG